MEDQRDMSLSQDDQIAKRRAELLAEQMINAEKEKKRDPEASDEEDEEEMDPIEQILSEEFPEEEEEEQEEEEQEEDDIERMKSEIGEKCEADGESRQVVKDELQSLMVPCATINTSRKLHIMHFQLYEKLKNPVENRESLFEKCFPISLSLASKMLHMSYKHPSIFRRWDPVKVLSNTKSMLGQGEVIQPLQNQENPSFPLIYRQFIYFFLTKENRNTFMKNPIKCIHQPKPKPSVPIKIAIIGPPKSGKTTVANMFASIYGLQRLSMGDAIRSVLDSQPDTELALDIKSLLVKGLAVPDELAVRCLEVTLMGLTCSTTGVVLDEYPATEQQAIILQACSTIPIKIFELEIPMKEILYRGQLDKKKSKRYESIVPGNIENAAKYRDKIYIFESEEKLQKFMRFPEQYWNHTLPSKLPPKMEPIVRTSLPLTGYLEQGAATALIKALNDVGCLKPMYPFLSVKRSALLYIAYHLNDYIRNKYKKKIEKSVECCDLIDYLGDKMTRKYKEPQRRPIDFDFKMQGQIHREPA